MNAKTFRPHAHLWLIVAVLASLGLSLWTVGVTRAAGTITVNSKADAVNNSDGLCTLREAIISANKDQPSGSNSRECGAGNGSDTIIIPGGTYTLTRTDNGKEDASSTGDLDITTSITLAPTGAVTITAISGFTDRIFHVLSTGNLTISSTYGVTISGGNDIGDGGGIYNGSALTLTNVTVSGNKASGKGGGIYNAGTLTINNSTVGSNNTAGTNGGGIYNAGTANLTNDTISGNTAKTDGGGLYNTGTVTLTNVTVAFNTADSDANGTGNGGGVFQSSSTVSLKNTLIGKNSDSSASNALAKQQPDCSGALTSQGNNLLGDNRGCSGLTNGTNGDLVGNVSSGGSAIDPKLGGLQNNGGPTFTHALSVAIGQISPAINAGTNSGCPATDQRGLPRPVGLACDIGAYEVQDLPQPGPTLTVNITNDTYDGACSLANCSLREAILAANAHPNGATPDNIQFTFSGPAPHVIQPLSALPPITDPLIIDGTAAAVELDGVNAVGCADGLIINTSSSQVRGLTIHGFCGDGVHVLSGTGNTITANSIFDNGGLGINLGSDGVTPNDLGDSDTGANNQQNFPALFAATDAGNMTIKGRFDGAANTPFTLEFFSTPTCDNPSGFGEGQTYLPTAAPVTVSTDENGNAHFQATVLSVVPDGQFVSATATDPNGSTSEFSQCTMAGPDNDSWPTAYRLDPSPGPVTYDQYVDRQGQSRWFKFHIEPGSKVIVTLTNLPTNYDLTIYKDINATFQSLIAPQDTEDLAQLGAEFAADAFSADRFSADAFSADRFSADAFSADRFSADRFSADRFSADAFSADRFSADIFSADAFSADRFSADRFSADRFSADRFSADRFSEEAFSTAQLRSLLGGSGFDGTASEGLRGNTWNNTGDFYVRVRGRNGAFSPFGKFHLSVTLLTGTCGAVSPMLDASQLLAGSAGGFNTIILTDLSRMHETVPGNSSNEKALLEQRLALLAARSEVNGVVVDVSQDSRVADANGQADTHPECPFAKNLVAGAIKDIVDRYRALNPSLQYVVIVGNDNVIPFFRHPDQALLGNESNYVPPVKDATASQASLKLGYVLSQDDYGAQTSLSLNDDAFPIPDLAVGRLVETAADATVVLDAYLSTSNGVVTPSTSPLVTGYDFLEDAAISVTAELEAGTGLTADTLITPNNVPPQNGWTADNLRAELFLGGRHDLIFLAGHFSANSALAADFATRVQSTELASAPADFTNSIIFSIGCHSGYNIVDEHGIPIVTVEPDWAQAFAQRGATLIAGTGYQYGDTDFLAYSEVLYLEFSRQLRTGPDDVAIGKALVEAKQAYLAETPVIRGIHEKALLEATLFGLPMLKVHMPGERLPAGGGASSGISPTPVPPTAPDNPGHQLGLSSADLLVTPSLVTHTVDLSDTTNLVTVTTTYVSGSNGVVTNNAEPVLPLEVRNVTVPGTVLRGVGFRGGAYGNTPNIIPLVGAAGTELGGVHTPFSANTFYPCQPWSLNYFDALANAGGLTNLMVTPAQFLSSSPTVITGTLRLWSNMNFRLYYSNYLADNASAAAPPSITHVGSTVAGGVVTFTVQVLGDPAAGIQGVWVTWTDISNSSGGQWHSIDLTQDSSDSRLWRGTLTLGSMNPANIRFIAQAVNGVGLVSSATNLCAYFIPGVDVNPTTPTSLLISPASGSGPYGTQATFSAVLTSNGTPLSGQPVNFSLGPVSRLAITDGNGRATATLLLLGTPDVTPYDVQAVFGGTATYIPSFSTGSFTITKQGTTLTLPAATGHHTADVIMTATLKDNSGRPLSEKTVFFIVTGSQTQAVARITDFAGRAYLGDLSWPSGTYTVDAYFGGFIPISGLPQPLDDDRYTSSTASNTLTLTNVAPAAAADAYNVNEDTTLAVSAPGVLTNDTDADLDSLTAALVDGPAHGALTLKANGSFVYTPTANYNGLDSFTYKANDGEADSNVATVILTVNPVNDNPTANPDETTVNEDSLNNPIGVLANDSIAPDVGETLSVTGVSDPPHGSAAFTATGVTYTPDANYFGDDTFTYAISDGNGGTASATVTVHVNNVNDNPTANPDETTVNEDSLNNPIDVLANDSYAPDPPETLSVTGVSDPPHGTAAFTATGVTYTPDANYFGDDTFTYAISDGNGGTASANVTVHVNNVNNNPTANPDSASVAADSTNNPIDVLANDSYAPDPPETLSVTGVSDPPHGTAAFTATGVTYTPDAGFTGPDSFTYTIGDGHGGTATATVTITVNPPNRPPDCSGATTDEVSIWSPDKSFHSVHVIGVTDPDGDAITITITSLFQDEPTGSNWPDGMGIGTDTAQLRAERAGNGDGRVYHIFFTASDGHGGTCSGEVKIGVVPHDQGSGINAIDQGALYNSTGPN